MKRDQLIGALIGIVRATDNAPGDEETFQVIVDGLKMDGEDEVLIENQYKLSMNEKFRLVPDCMICKTPCGRTFNYDMNDLWEEADEELKQAKIDLLNDLIEVAKSNPSYTKEAESYLYDGLFAIGDYYMASQFDEFKERKKQFIK